MAVCEQDGASIYYQVIAPNGMPVLFVHGTRTTRPGGAGDADAHDADR
jgi:hypothetical protein